jgi:hypothetical protein
MTPRDLDFSMPAGDWRPTPPDILAAIQRLEEAVGHLTVLGKSIGLDRKFTLDGRLVGDIGELIVARHYEVVKHDKPKGHAHDLFAMVDGKKVGVQVKLRREADGGFEMKFLPDVLIVLQFQGDWTRWREIYHGSGTVLLRDGLAVDADGRFLENGAKTAVEFTMDQLRSWSRPEHLCMLTPKANGG